MAFAVWAARTLGRALTPLPRPREQAPLVTDGPYALVRHPIYTGVLALAFGYGLLLTSWPALALAGVLTVVFDLKSRLEEGWLGERYPGYGAYRARVPRRLVPLLY